MDGSQGARIRVWYDGQSITGQYRVLSGNRLEVSTDRSTWITNVDDVDPVEAQAEALLSRIEFEQRQRRH